MSNSKPQENPQRSSDNSSNQTSSGSGPLSEQPDTRPAPIPADNPLSSLVEQEQEASRDVVRACVFKVAYLMEPDMSDHRAKALTQYISDQGYTTGELAHAADVLPRDDHLEQKLRYGKPLTPRDFERIVLAIRELSESVKQPMSAEQMRRAIQLEPGLDRNDFEQTHRPQHEGPDPYLITEEALNEHFDMTRKRHRHSNG